uniref:cadherin-related family member 2-like n=1 Tax=Myxine glutinosa TaxID=7769 RepID=UPI00358DD99E
MERIPTSTRSQSTDLYDLSAKLSCIPVGATFSLEDSGGDVQSYFNVNESTGNIALKKCIDRDDNNLPCPRNKDVTDSIMLTVALKDENQESLCEDVLLIIVEDVNDNIPKFNLLPYSKSIDEANFTEPFFIFPVNANDPDEGEAGTLTYSIMWTPHIDGVEFSINKATGSISVNGSLIYNENMLYYIDIEARDGADQYGTVHNATANLVVTVKDIPNLPPEFTSTSYSGTVDENSTQHFMLLPIVCFTWTTYFHVNNKTGDVFLNGTIDREKLPEDRIEFQIHATEIVNNTETNSTAAVDVSVVVLDVNDNPPIFWNFTKQINSITVEVQENSPTGTPVEFFENVSVRDADEGKYADMHLIVDPKNMSIYPTKVDGQSPLSLRVKTELDYESIENFTVEVIATDGKYNTTLTVLVVLINLNDNSPTFNQSNYDVDVYENATRGNYLTTIHVTDKDKGIYGNVHFELEGSKEVLETFSLNNITGILSIKNALLDYEVKPTYFATVMAIDGGGIKMSTALEINILDVNDNSPKWLPLGTLIVTEEEPLQNPLFLKATDLDKPNTPNSQVSYHIQSCFTSRGEDLDLVSNFTVVNASLIINGVLDRESLPEGINGGHLKLTIVAEDHGNPRRWSTVNATVIVMDKNDHTPQFHSSSYAVCIPESTIPGAYLLNVSAVDGDSEPPNNQFQFSFSFDPSNAILTVRPNGENGVTRIQLGSKLDYETKKEYTMILQAIDMGEHPRTGNTTINIHVEDVNDEPPKFSKSSYTWEVHEGNYLLPQNFSPLDIKGSDSDTNANLLFKITEEKCEDNKTLDVYDWIGINKTTGLLIPQGIIDYEACKQLKLVICLTDENTVLGSNSSDADVTVNIVDENDNAPYFINPETSEIIIAELAKEDYQVATYMADDSDSGKNAELTFAVESVHYMSKDGKLTEESNDLFKIETNAPTIGRDYFQGVFSLGTNAQLKPEGYYQSALIVKDNGTKPLSASLQVRVYMIPQNCKVELIFTSSVDEVTKNLPEIISTLRSAVKATVAIASLHEETKETRDTDTRSILDTYFYYSNGTSLLPTTVMSLLDADYNALVELSNLGLVSVNPPKVPDVTSPELPWQIAVGVIAGILALILVISITSAICMRRSFERRIKTEQALRNTHAALASNALSYQQQPHNKENPLFNKEAIELPYDDIDTDVEKHSINSLDERLNFDAGTLDCLNTFLEGEDSVSHRPPILKETLKEFGNSGKSLSSTEI